MEEKEEKKKAEVEVDDVITSVFEVDWCYHLDFYAGRMNDHICAIRLNEIDNFL